MADLLANKTSLSDFKQHADELLAQMKDGDPVVLTVDGKPRLVVQDAEAYEELLDRLDEAQAVAGIRRGLEDVRNGRTQPAHEAFAEIRAKHNISTRSRRDL